MMRLLAGAIAILVLAPSDSSAQRISTWEEPRRPVAADTVNVQTGDAELGEQVLWGALVGGVAAAAGRADAAEADPADPFGRTAAQAYDAPVFDVLDFTLSGAVSAAIAAAATEWARDRLTE